ncbi:MAG TPA: NUDIX domain-containing protein [Candidatus Poseidoniaceae archaeon]|nr:NUDIX domain-containing protein [Candidatus Poseidoniaceae archaeon]
MNKYLYVMGFITLDCLPSDNFSGDEKWLMVKHSIRGWELPGGKINSGENYDDAILREVLEESGIESYIRCKPKEYDGGLVYWMGISEDIDYDVFNIKDPIIEDIRWFSSPPEDLAWGVDELKNIINLFN